MGKKVILLLVVTAITCMACFADDVTAGEETFATVTEETTTVTTTEIPEGYMLAEDGTLIPIPVETETAVVEE